MAAVIRSFLLLLSLLALCQGNVLRDGGAELAAESGPRISLLNKYQLYTRTNFRNGEEITATTLAASSLGAADDTVIIIHGQFGTGTSSLNIPIKDAFLGTGTEYNVICMDWGLIAGSEYNLALNYLPGVAQGLGELLTALNAIVQPARVHIIGFGLGAHLAGMASRVVDGNVGRITGLDPSGNAWGSSSNRLRPSDANYVEVIHTDSTGNNANGISDALGHVDFYPNGGNNRQPGCSNNACSHTRAWELYLASITNQFTGIFCEDYAQMSSNRCVGWSTAIMGGVELDQVASGIYRLATGRVFPFV